MHDERFTRTRHILGPDGLERLTRAHVAVIGLGAVGSYAVEALTRSGIGRLTLVDFDEVSLSNINRQLYALESTVGKPKADLARNRVRDINPSCRVDSHRCFVDAETAEHLLDDRPDLVIDAIDSLNPKVDLLAAVRTRQIPLVSSMGAALRRRPGLVRVSALEDTHSCPLARQVRKRLRRREVPLDFPCVWSAEEPDRDALLDLEESEKHLVDRGRKRRSLGSLPTITGIFGLTAANTALQILLDEDWSADN
ncbi:MAG: ThiF family adenylyltransferase [Phycisphaerae bacterium]